MTLPSRTPAGSRRVGPCTKPVAYVINFVESGLPSRTGWGINLTTQSAVPTLSTNSTGTTSNFQLSNGSYWYTIRSPSGYSPSVGQGNLAVSGQNATPNVTFTANKVSGTGGILPSGTLLVVAAVLALGAATVTVVFLRRRSRALGGT